MSRILRVTRRTSRVSPAFQLDHSRESGCNDDGGARIVYELRRIKVAIKQRCFGRVSISIAFAFERSSPRYLGRADHANGFSPSFLGVVLNLDRLNDRIKPGAERKRVPPPSPARISDPGNTFCLPFSLSRNEIVLTLSSILTLSFFFSSS